MWIVMVVVLTGAILMARPRKLIPGRAQNLFEWFYEFIGDFGLEPSGPTGKPYIPLFVAFFLLILFNNWVGLIPPVGRIEELRAPSSDVNITIGLALVAFIIFEVEGFRKLGFSGYLGKFFPFYEFKHGIGAGIIALFVGLVELMLEFVKPVTLSMRLFGNIYGGEVALGVMTALTIAFIPVGSRALEADAQCDPGAHLQRADPHVHRAGHREPSRGGGRGRRGGTSGRSRGRSRPGSSPPTDAPDSAPTPRPNDPGSKVRARGGTLDMEHIGAGLAALGVFGPGIGIGILAGLSAQAIGRNPDAAGQIRGIAIILAAFAEGLGVLAIVVGLLADLHQVAEVGDAVDPGRRHRGGPRRPPAHGRGRRHSRSTCSG